MAIDSSIANSLTSNNYNQPYIHSNIYHIFDVINLSNNDESFIKRDLEATITLYEKYISQLRNYEQELYDYCKVADYQQLNVKLFGKNSHEDTFTQIAYQVLQDPNFIRSLVPQLDKNAAQAVFSTLANHVDRFGTQYFDALLNDDGFITLPELTKIFTKELINEKGGYIGQKEVLQLLDPNAQQILQNEITKLGTKKIKADASSRNSKIKIFAKDIIINKIGKQIIITQNQFITNFVDCFNKLLVRNNYILPFANEDEIQNIIYETANSIYNILAPKGSNLPVYLANILGHFAEYGIHYTVEQLNNSIDIKLEVETVGDKSEIELAKELSKLNINKTQMQYHDPTKQSQTDLYFKIYDGQRVKIFRVQSKNALLDFINDYDDSVSKNRPMIVKAEKQIKVKDLMQNLLNHNFLTNQQTQQIAYFLANATWFYNKGSYGDEDNTGRRRVGGSHGGITGIMYMVERILSQGIGAFIGMTINDGLANVAHDINLNATNIFYFLGNRALFPLSEILQAAVQTMRNVEQELTSTRLHYVADMSKAQYAYQTAQQFFDAKVSATGKLISNGNYSDARLLGIGQQQGSAIMSSAEGHINLDFQIVEILRSSSYVFNIKDRL